MMVLHCRKVEIQGDEEAGGAVRRTWEGRRKREVECTEEKLLVLLVKGGCCCLIKPAPCAARPTGNVCYFLWNQPATTFLILSEREKGHFDTNVRET